MDELCSQKLVLFEAVDSDVDVDFSTVLQRLGADAGCDEGREGCDVDRDALLVNVVQNGECFLELVLACESLYVFVDGAWVLTMEG